MNITESIKFNKLKEENEKLKSELAEKDKVIELMNEQCDGAIKELQQTQLFKEDFIYLKICEKCREYEDKCKNWTYPPNHKEYYKKYFVLIDNSKYDKLPSKDVK